jgi:hypothetical protein
VGFAPRRDAEQLPEGAGHAAIMLKNHDVVKCGVLPSIRYRIKHDAHEQNRSGLFVLDQK